MAKYTYRCTKCGKEQLRTRTAHKCNDLACGGVLEWLNDADTLQGIEVIAQLHVPTACEMAGHWWAYLRTLHKEQVVDVFYCQRCLEYKEVLSK